MELEELTPKTDGGKEEDAAKEPVLEVQKSDEETQPDHYSKLGSPTEDVYTDASSAKAKAEEAEKRHSPAEDVYAEAHFGDSSEDKKDEAKENLSSQLTVKLEDEQKGKQTDIFSRPGNVRLYRVGCLVLTVLCLVLLLVVIVLSMKLQTVCSEGEEADGQASTCSYERCQARFGNGGGGCNHCPPSWLAVEKTCFYLSTHRLSWEESQSYCSVRGGTLAVINSQKLQVLLSERGNLKYWIGLTRKGNKWSWVDNNSVRKSYWENNVSPEGCGILNSQGPAEKNWQSHPCDDYTYFICQRIM